MKYFLFLIMAAIIILSCQTEQRNGESSLGLVEFKVNGNENAQPYFHRGLLLLHSFQYSDAADEFRKAQELDPEFAMAYWGEAMTNNHPLWSAQYYEKATTVLKKFGPTSDERLNKVSPGIERDFFTGVEILYGEGDKFERDKKFSSYMESLYEKYPGNHEVAAFYALSLLGSVAQGGRDIATYEKGAVIAKSILNENPDHPGALHYLIHSYDDPDHAYLALEAANSYSKVAPDAAHALHMPSHIYVAMGMWDEVISSNIASYQASINRMKKKELSNNARNYHAFHWLLYGRLQKGQYGEADKIMQEMMSYVGDDSSPNARAYLTAMKGAFLIETEDWSHDVSKIQIKHEDLNVSLKSILPFLNGMVAFHNDDLENLNLAIAELQEFQINAENKLATKGIAVCSGVGWATQTPSPQDIKQAKVLEIELAALQAFLTNDPGSAEKKFKEATQLEESLTFIFGPPLIVKPSHELYGEFLLNQERYEEAIMLFDKTMERAPKRTLALRGKLKALSALGMDEEMREVEQQLIKNGEVSEPAS